MGRGFHFTGGPMNLSDLSKAWTQRHIIAALIQQIQKCKYETAVGAFSVYWGIVPLIMQSAHYFLLLINLFGFLTSWLFTVSTSWKQNKKLHPTELAGRSLRAYGPTCCWCLREETLARKLTPPQSQPFSPAESLHSFMYPNRCLSLYLLSLNLTVMIQLYNLSARLRLL